MRCGIVVPTLGTRPELLRQCLQSIRKAGATHICLVAPAAVDLDELKSEGLIDQRLDDPMQGLPGAIDFGLMSLPLETEYANWLGDDDLLSEGSLQIAAARLDADQNVVLVFGGCEYISDSGRKIFTNRSGQWAVPLLRFGPCLVPQPGSLFRLSTYRQIGGLSRAYGWAFDFDLFIRMSKIGRLQHVPEVLASFRWHHESLSVGSRDGSVREASIIRRVNLPKFLRQVSLLWELPVRYVTKFAGTLVTRRIN